MTPSGGALPAAGRGILSDLRDYVLTRSPISTLVEFPSIRERVDYSKRILQRLAVDVDPFSVLNIHRIGIDAPARYVFDELVGGDMERRCWPGHLATQRRSGSGIEDIRLVLCGNARRLQRLGVTVFGPRFGTLFRMRLIRARSSPDPADFDNARYLLYDCGGGYPVGVLGIYIRSTLAQRGETGTSQFFFFVGFNFYGHRARSRIRPVQRLWEGVHDRVTENVLNRFKRLCEARFAELREGFQEALPHERIG